MNCYSRSILACICILFFSCKHEINKEVAPQDGNYPPEIAKIIVTRCATSCHNAASYKLSGGLLLDTWEHLFNGGSNGASVVAYSPDNSPLLYFINTDSSLGLVSYPTMPYNAGNGSSEKPLTRDEYMTIRNWIANGAPDKNGNIPFASDVATRQKYYMACQGSGKCRLVGVIDAEKRVVMRYIDIGVSNLQDIAHNIRVSPDGRYAYVCFYSGRYLLKIDTYTDQIIAKAEIGTKQWSVMNISPDGKSLLVSDWETSGSVYLISTDDMKIVNVYNGAPDNFHLPHGLAANATFDTFYTAGQYGNLIYKFSKDGNFTQNVVIDTAAATYSHSSTTPDPHDIFMAPDYSKYFLSCENTNELRVMDAHADTLIKVLPVGKFPQELTISKSRPYIFVSCMEDVSPNAKSRGSVYVCNYNDYTLVKRIDGSFFQPHGICVDDKNGVFYIVSRNFDPTDNRPSHCNSVCGQRNGWYQVFDLNTLAPVSNKLCEVTPDPYFIDTRFK